MIMTLRGTLLAASLLALPLAASAQPVTGLYISGGIGANLLQDESVKSVGGVATSGMKLDTHVGPAFVGAMGWGFGNGLRAEVEFDFRNNPISGASDCPGGCSSVRGSENKFGPMVNLAYDFNLGPIVPYIGAGVGYQFADDDISSGSSVLTDTKGAFAYQAILGLGFPIAAAPGLTVDVEYRFMGLAGTRDYVEGANTVSLGNEYNHAIMLGVRYNIGVAPAPMAAAPAAAPAPAVQPARSYLVFFDWDKATLTVRAQQIIKEAADNSMHVKVTRIEVNGYTDTSGTPQYNMGLSIRRAASVKAELIRDGVSAGEISTMGFGETHLLVPTGPGVREPQNRRVEIILH
jgi:outer membrane protein OmpA-like peptidoglycan-associated protein